MAIMIYLFDKRKNRKCVQKKGDKETEENTRNVFIYLPLRPANGLSFYMHTRIHACINPRVSRQSIQICHYLSIVIQQVRFCTNICVCVCVCFEYFFYHLPLPDVPHFLEINRELPPTPHPTSI